MVVQVGRGGVDEVVVDVEGVGLSLAGWLVAPVAAVETRRDHTAAQLRPPHNLCNTSSHYQLLEFDGCGQTLASKSFKSPSTSTPTYLKFVHFVTPPHYLGH